MSISNPCTTTPLYSPFSFVTYRSKAIDLWLVRANELSTNGSPGEEAVTPEQVAEQTEISEILGENITALEDELAKVSSRS